MSRPARTAARTEHDRLLEIKDKSQALGEFLDWLRQEKRVVLASVHEHTNDCGRWCEREYAVFTPRTETLLAEFFDIDLAKLEREKRQMLAGLRKQYASEEIDKELGL